MSTMNNELILIFCMVMMLLCSLAAAMFRSMVKSAISLAAVSVFLSIFMFTIGATWAAVFELSVCSGLITVIFISGVSLTSPDRHSVSVRAFHLSRYAMLPFLLILLGVGIIAVIILSGFDVVSTADITQVELPLREVFWNLRQADILGQIIVILVGAFAVVILFKEGNKKL